MIFRYGPFGNEVSRVLGGGLVPGLFQFNLSLQLLLFFKFNDFEIVAIVAHLSLSEMKLKAVRSRVLIVDIVTFDGHALSALVDMIANFYIYEIVFKLNGVN